MEACFSQLTLDVIGKAVFNYDFDALTMSSPVIQVLQQLPYSHAPMSCCRLTIYLPTPLWARVGAPPAPFPTTRVSLSQSSRLD